MEYTQGSKSQPGCSQGGQPGLFLRFWGRPSTDRFYMYGRGGDIHLWVRAVGQYRYTVTITEDFCTVHGIVVQCHVSIYISSADTTRGQRVWPAGMPPRARKKTQWATLYEQFNCHCPIGQPLEWHGHERSCQLMNGIAVHLYGSPISQML